MNRPVISVFIFLAIAFSISSCNDFARADGEKTANYDISKLAKKTEADSTSQTTDSQTHTTCLTEKSIIDCGLVDIKTIDSSIIVDMKYSTTDNFIGVDVYGDFNKCYLQPDVAEKLKLAQQYLREKYPYYSLIVYDAARPRSVQRIMWDTVKIPIIERTKYLSNPNGGSLHNFGAAVDISIVDEHGHTLNMGTPYDYFGELAYPKEEQRLLVEGKLTNKQILNRDILRSVMYKAGFWGIATEWWHFNSCTRDVAYQKYKIIE